jgi:SNF2 family DNA or RNA helicase
MKSKNRDLIICPNSCVTAWRDVVRDIMGIDTPCILLSSFFDVTRADDLLRESVVIVSSTVLTRSASQSMRICAQREELARLEWNHVVIDEAQLLLGSATHASEFLLERLLLPQRVKQSVWAMCGCAANGALPKGFDKLTNALGCAQTDILHRRRSSCCSTLVGEGGEDVDEDEEEKGGELLYIDFASSVEAEFYQKMIRHRGKVKALRCRQFCADPYLFKRCIEMQAMQLTTQLLPRISPSSSSSSSSSPNVATDSFFTDLLLSDFDETKMTRTKIEYVYQLVLGHNLEKEEEEEKEEKEDRHEDRKFVIFCTWKPELDAYMTVLNQIDNVRCLRLFGGMAAHVVERVLDDFEEEIVGRGRKKVLLTTMKTGSVGINLQDTDHIILTSPQYDTFPEMQAIARSVGRKGGDRDRRRPRGGCDIKVSRLIIRGTIEEEVIKEKKKNKKK